MTTHTDRWRTPRTMLAAAAALTLVAASATVPADAAERGPRAGNRSAPQHVQKHRPQGDYTRHTEVRRTDYGHTRTDTWTGERGTTTRQAEVVNDRANQTRTRNVQWTGPQGQQSTRTEVTQRTESGYTRRSTATGAQGWTTTRNAVATRDSSTGTWTKDVTVERTPPSSGEGN